MVKIKELYQKGIKILEENEIETPKTDARVILEYVLGVESGKLPLYYEKEALLKIQNTYFNLIEKRKNHMPCSYITGKKEFMSLDFFVSDGVLIPRNETENLCEYCIEKINNMKINTVKVADICSGSGCIGLSIAHYCKNSDVELFELSDDAIEISKKNKESLFIKNADIYKMDILKEKPDTLYDVIISNPPYIPIEDIEYLMEEVRDYEPHIALTDGGDGIKFYKRLAEISEYNLKPGGFMAVEVGINMYRDVKNIFDNYGKTEIIYDDFGIERIVVLQKG